MSNDIFDNDFPSLKDRVCVRDGIASCTSFQIKNALDLEDIKSLLNQKFIRQSDVMEHCKDNKRILEAIRRAYKFERGDNWDQVLIEELKLDVNQ